MHEENELSECFFDQPQSYSLDIGQNYYDDFIPGTPKDINSSEFLDYFMKIDYSTDLLHNYDRDIQKQMIDSSTTSQSSNNHLNKKKHRDSQQNDDVDIDDNDSPTNSGTSNGVIVDELTNKTYNKKDDLIEYRKAKKRIQNRESALRTRKIKKENTQKMEDELAVIRKDNTRLFNENNVLKKEKTFLIEQIKYMQNLLKSSSKKSFLEDNSSQNSHSVDIEKATAEVTMSPPTDSSEKGYFYTGTAGKMKKGRLFNIVIVCCLALVYVGGEFSTSGTQQIQFGNKEISLNSVNETNNQGLWGIISKLILITIGVLIVPLLNQTKTIQDYFERGIRKKRQ